MQSWTIGTVAGITWVAWMARLPQGSVLLGLTLLSLVLVLWKPRWIYLAVLGLCCGMTYAQLWGQQLLAERLPEALEGESVWVEGEILQLPSRRSFSPGRERQRFPFWVTHTYCAAQAVCGDFSGKVLLSYYGERVLRAGERWRFEVKMKRPWGLANPGSFNFQSWLVQQNFAATGYARERTAQRLTRSSVVHYPVESARQAIGQLLAARLGTHSAHGILLALSIGDRSAISPADWQLVQHWGLSHLVVISGLHVGIVAGIGFLLGAQLGRLLVFIRAGLNRMLVAHLCAFLLALAYSALAGFALPTLRALVMLGAVQLAALFHRRSEPGRAFSLAVLGVCLIQPLATHNAGFYLSFFAVAMIFLILAWRRERRGLLLVATIQVLLSLGVGALASVWFGGISWLSPLANLVAVPVVSFMMTPLCLIATSLSGLWPDAAVAIWTLAGLPVESFLSLGKIAGEQQWSPWFEHSTSWPALTGIVLALLLIIVPSRWSLRCLLLPLLLPLLLVPARIHSPDELVVTVLDVGQGLAVVVRQGDSALLYDTGAGDPMGPNMTSSVILPYLAYSGIDRIDALIISHSDNDHASGVRALADWGGVKELRYGESRLPVAIAQQPCVSGAEIQLGELQLRILHPGIDYTGSANSLSCVLMIQHGEFSVLLPGDIDASVEKRLVRQWGETLRATVLIAPHHGSRTSSSPALLTAVRPALVVFSAGYLSRFGHPHESVERRYRQRGVQLFNTATSGAVTLRYDSGRLSIEEWRAQRRLYWQ